MTPSGLISGEQLIGRWDPDARLYVVTGRIYGPAGSATVDLGAGVQVSVDYANPDLTCTILVEGPLSGDARELDPAATNIARALLGDEALDGLLALGAPDAPNRALRIADPAGVRREQAGRRAALGRLGLLMETTEDADVSPLMVAVASLEAAVVAGTVDPNRLWLVGIAETLAAVGAGSLLTLAERRLVVLPDSRTEAELADVLRRATTLLRDGSVARRLTSLADRVEQGALRGRAPLVAALRVAPDQATESERPVMPSLAGVPVEVDGPAGTRALLVTETQIEVQLPPAGMAGSWARAFRRKDGLLLALAPVRPAPDNLALLVVPPHLRPAELLVDITDAPQVPRPSPTLAAVREAATWGRDACRRERSRRDASAEWTRSAEAWEEAGDERRAGMARRFAGEDRWRPPSTGPGGPGEPPEPFLTDQFG